VFVGGSGTTDLAAWPVGVAAALEPAATASQ
jgi:hypothetical protein